MNRVDTMIETIEDISVTVESYKTYETPSNDRTNGNGNNGNSSCKKAKQNNSEDSDLLEKIRQTKLLNRDDAEEFLQRHHDSRVNFLKEIGLSEVEANEWADGSIEIMRQIG